VHRDSSWQAQAKQGFDIACFAVDWEAQQVVCPQGQLSRVWSPSQDQGHRLLQVGIALFVFSGLEGFAIPHLPVPRLGLSVHTLSTGYRKSVPGCHAAPSGEQAVKHLSWHRTRDASLRLRAPLSMT
jgi:hypothetical protein